MLAGVNTLCESLNVDLVGCSLGLFATSEGSGKSELNLLVSKSDSELAIFSDGVSLVVDCPSDGYVIIELTNKRKLDGGVLGYVLNNGEVVDFSLDLFSSGLFNKLIVGERSYAHRNEVGSAVVKDEDTGNICGVAEVSCMVSVDSTLLISLKSGGEVGNVGSYVTLLLADSEVEVLGGVLYKILSSDGNALDGNLETNECAEVCACSELFGDINNGNFLDGSVKYCNLTALDLLHAGVGLHRTGNLNGHTNLDSEIGGIVGYAVAVVTTGYGSISDEEVVVLVAKCLRVDCNNDTFNGEGVALLSCHVLCMRVNLIHRNGALEGNSLGGAVCSLNGCGKSVLNLFSGLFINADENLTVCGSANSNLVGVNRPFYLVCNAANDNLRHELIVNCGNGCSVSVESINVCSSTCNIICYRGGSFGGFFFVGCGRTCNECRTRKKSCK